MTDQELADAIRARFGAHKYDAELLRHVELDILKAHPRWEPKWGDKVRHGGQPEPRWYVGPNPQREGEHLTVEADGVVIHVMGASLRPWVDDKPGYPE